MRRQLLLLINSNSSIVTPCVYSELELTRALCDSATHPRFAISKQSTP